MLPTHWLMLGLVSRRPRSRRVKQVSSCAGPVLCLADQAGTAHSVAGNLGHPRGKSPQIVCSVSPREEPARYLTRGDVIFNRFNWLGLFRAFWVLGEPFQFLVGLLRCRAPETVHVLTPVGRITLTLRNAESLKTLFSIFCR